MFNLKNKKTMITRDKELYETNIIQGIFERLNELEDKIKELEDKKNDD